MKVIQSQNRNSGEISFVVWIRTIAVLLILLCHLTQTHQNEYIIMSSQIFNVGVNIFIIISGFLFGRLGVKPPYRKWLLKRLKRIFIPYWSFLVILLTIQIARDVFFEWKCIIYSFLGVHGFTYAIPGAEHTWFISAILLCYMFTPLICAITDRIIKTNCKLLFVVFLFSLGLLPIGIAFFPNSAILITVPFYTLAYMLGRYWHDNEMSAKEALVALSVSAISFIFRFCLRFWIDGTFIYDSIVAPYSHYIAGFGIFMASAWLFKRKPWSVVTFISTISFEIYLFHYMFMWPPLSVMAFTGSWCINAIVAVNLAVLTAVIIHHFVDLTNSRHNNNCNKR